MNTLTRVPLRGWNRLGDFEQLVDDCFTRPVYGRNPEQAFAPAMDIVENETAYVVRADLPGIDKQTLAVSIKDNVLTIETNPTQAVANKDETVIQVERRTGKYKRMLKLGNQVDAAAISAEYVDGVLQLTLPKSAESVARPIDIAVR